jgi:hypothetical protein
MHEAPSRTLFNFNTKNEFFNILNPSADNKKDPSYTAKVSKRHFIS